MLYASPWSRFELITSVVIGTDYIGSCKSNHNTITATTAPTLNLCRSVIFIYITSFLIPPNNLLYNFGNIFQWLHWVSFHTKSFYLIPWSTHFLCINVFVDQSLKNKHTANCFDACFLFFLLIFDFVLGRRVLFLFFFFLYFIHILLRFCFCFLFVCFFLSFFFFVKAFFFIIFFPINLINWWLQIKSCQKFLIVNFQVENLNLVYFSPQVQ